MLIWPWRVNQYPGQARALADLLGIELRSAELLIGGHGHVAPKHLRRMADFLEASIATKQAVLAELQAHVEMVEKERAMHPNRGYQNGIMKWRREQALAKASGTSTDR